MQIRILKSGPGCVWQPGQLLRVHPKQGNYWISMGFAVAVGEKIDPDKICERPDDRNYPSVGEDITSIVIPVYNQPTYLRRCIKYVEKHTKNYEIILVDDGSNAETKKALNTIKKRGHRVLTNEKNLGFPATVNRGILHAKGKRICLLNTDTVVTDGWLEEMETALKGRVGLVGPTTNYSLGLQCDRRLLKGTEFRDTQTGHATDPTLERIERSAARYASERGKYITMAELGGFCLLIDRRVITEIGAFDPVFGIGCGEEVDFEDRAKRAGWQLVWAKGAFVWHYGHKSLMDRFRNGETGLAKQLKENHVKSSRHAAERGADKRGLQVPFFDGTPILFPTWNRLEYTKKSLVSLLETAPNAKIVIYDDGSDDGTVEWLEEFDHPNIVAKVYNTKRRGIDAQMDRFFSYLAGMEWAAKMDNDSILSNGWLDTLINISTEAELVTIQPDHHTGGRHKFFNENNRHTYGDHDVYQWHFVGGSGVVISVPWVRKNIGLGMTVWHPKHDKVPGGWTRFQEAAGGKKAFTKELFLTTLDTSDDTTRVDDYPEYNKNMAEERSKCYNRKVKAKGAN